MKNKKLSICVFLFICLALGSSGLLAQKKQSLPTQKQAPLPFPLPCPDIKVNSIYVKLVSTTANDPQVDIAADKILLSFTAKNVGTAPIPISARWRTIIKRNNVELTHGSIWTSIGAGSIIAPGSSVGRYDIPDTFPHGMRTTYSVQVITDFKECTTANNQLSFTIDEAQLHPQKKQDLSTHGQIPPANVLSCPDVNVLSLKATLISTQLGDPAFESPRDTVRLEVTLENAGRAEIPRGKMLHAKILKNSTATYNSHPIDAAKAQGSRWTYAYTDSFPHGIKTTFIYQVLSISDMKECTTANNQASLTIDEERLHHVRKHPPIRK